MDSFVSGHASMAGSRERDNDISVVSNGRKISEQWIGKDVEGNGRVPICGITQAFAWRDWGNH
jgi:hypothetical protein